MRLASLFVITSFLMGCLDEPQGKFCTLISVSTGHCIPTDVEKPESEKSTKEMLGYICESPDFFAGMKKHHKDLHTELESCEAKLLE